MKTGFNDSLGYIVFSPDKDGILHIKGVMRSNSKLQMSTTGYGNGSSVRSTVTSNTNYDDVDIPVAQGSTYYIYNDGNNPTSINTLTYKYTREAFDGIKGYVNRATNTYTFQIGNAEAATVKETQVKADENKYVDMAVYLGAGDSLAQGEGIKFVGPTIPYNNSNSIGSVGNGRYIVITPKYNGQFTIKTAFEGATDTSRNVARVHYSEIEEGKNPTDYTRSVSNTGNNPTSSTINMKAGKSYVIFTYNKACTISAISYTYDKTIGIDYENEKFTNIIDGDYTITGEGLEKSLPTGSNSAIAIDNSYFVGDITISGTGDGNVISQALTLTRPAAPDVTTDYTVTQPETANEKGTVTAQNDAVLQYSTDGSEWTDVPEEIAQGTTFYLRKAATDSAFASTATEEITIDTISVPTYTVTWKVEDQQDNVQSLDYGAAIEAPQEPEKAEDNGHTYTFEGWHITTAEGEKVESFGTVSGDVTYVAVFTSVNKTFNVTYHSDHGTQPEAATYTYGTGIAELPQLTDTNYSFGGWYDGDDFTTANEVTSISTSDFGDKNLYAKWTAKNYTITYNTNGGSAVAEETVAYDTIIPVPNSNPTKSGYEFAGWYTDEQLTTPLADGAKVTGNQTLYAKWTPISYSITKASMTNGTVNLNAATATVEDTVTVTIVPDTGYQLASLTVGGEAVTGDALTNAINSNSYTFNMPAKVVEVSATFERKAVNKIEITLDNSTATHGTAATITATAKVYASDNTDITTLYASDIVWSLDDATTTGGKTTISDNGARATVSVGVEQAVGTVTVTATVGGKSDNKEITVSSEPTYTITIDNTITGGTVTTTPSGSNTKGQTVTITTTPDDGYQLKADSVKVNGGAVTVTNNTFTMPEENVTVTAEFELKTYTITWNNDTNTLIDTTTVEHGTVPTHSNPTKEPTAQYTYTFEGWTPTIVAATENVTYTAQFSETKKKYNITKATVSDGNSFTISAESIEWGEAITVTPAAAEGYELTALTVTGTTTAYSIGEGITKVGDTYTFTMPTENVTVTPTFEATAPVVQQYTVTYAGTATGGTYSVTGITSGAKVDENTVITINPAADTANGYVIEAVYAYHTGDARTEIDKITDNGGYKYTVTADTTVEVTFKKIKYTITWKNWDGETLTTTEVEHGTVPSYPNDAAAPTKDSDSEYDYTFDKWTPNLTEATAAAEYTATYTQVAKEAPKTFLNLHEGFSSWLKIEKTNAADSDDVVLTVSKDQESQNDIPTLTAYIAVYNNGVLQSVKKHDFVSNAATLPALEATGEYKIFIWADQMEPVIEAVTPNTTGANKLFD